MRRAAPIVLAGLLSIAGLLALGGTPAPGATAARRAPASRSSAVSPPPLSALHGSPVTVAVGTTSPASPVPGNFLGLSFEVRELALIGSYSRLGNLVDLLHSLPGSVLRFGGQSVDEQTAWTDGGARPAWASTSLDAQSLRGIARLAGDAGWSVLLSVTLGHPDVATAAAEAAAAHAILGSRLVGLAIGNEPDRYTIDGLRPPSWGFSDYLQEIAGYLPALRTAAPGVPIVGPDASTGVDGVTWLGDYATAEHPPLLTYHYYPTSRCGIPPHITYLLGPVIRSQQRTALADVMAVAHANHAPVRIDETNNVSCSGQPGVSNSFGSALWALLYIQQAIAAGVSGLNFHDVLSEPQSYSPLVALGPTALQHGDLHAQPEWYALLMAHFLEGDRPVTALTSGAGAHEVAADALLTPGGALHVMLVDAGHDPSPGVVVHLAVPSRYAGGTILRLSGPKLAATGGVTLGGQAVAPDGNWEPAVPLPAVSGGSGTLAVSLPVASAALVTLYPKGRSARR